MLQSHFLPRRYAPSKALLRGSVSAGMPLDPAPFIARRFYRVPHEFRRFGMYALVVDGNSMTDQEGGGLPHGCLVLVDGHDIMTDRGHVYAFQRQDGTHMIKRLDLHEGRPALFSDNPEHRPIRVDATLCNAGKVYAVSLDGKSWTSLKYQATRRGDEHVSHLR